MTRRADEPPQVIDVSMRPAHPIDPNTPDGAWALLRLKLENGVEYGFHLTFDQAVAIFLDFQGFTPTTQERIRLAQLMRKWDTERQKELP